MPPVRMAMSSSMAFLRSPKPGGLHGGHMEGAADLVDDERRQGFAFDVFGNDQERFAHLGDLLQNGKKVLHAADLLFIDEDQGIFEFNFHLLGIGNKIGGDIAAVKLHPFHDLQFGLQAFGLFHGDDAFLADLFHRLGDDFADGLVIIGGDGADLGDLLLVLGRLAHLLEFCHDHVNGLVDSALDVHRIAPGGHGLGAFAEDRLGQNGGGGGAVAGNIACLAGYFLHHLGAHIFELVFKFDLFGDGHAVLGDSRCAEALSIMTFRPLGPRVTLTASARVLTPLRIDFLASSSY